MSAYALGAQPAHPMPVGVTLPKSGTYAASPIDGLTKRELFAAMAMQGLLAQAFEQKSRGCCGWREEFGRESVKYADCLLAALSDSRLMTHAEEGDEASRRG